jgi:hypothetical protein
MVAWDVISVFSRPKIITFILFIPRCSDMKRLRVFQLPSTECQSVAGSFPVSPVPIHAWDFPKLQSESSLLEFELMTF